MLGVDVDVLLVLLFEGEWFLLLGVVVFISFPCAGLPGPCCSAALPRHLPGPCCNAALPRHLPVRFFFSATLFASARCLLHFLLMLLPFSPPLLSSEMLVGGSSLCWFCLVG